MLKALRKKGLIKWENFSNNPNKLQYIFTDTSRSFGESLANFLFDEKKQAEYERLKKEIDKPQAHFDKNKESLQWIQSLVNG